MEQQKVDSKRTQNQYIFGKSYQTIDFLLIELFFSGVLSDENYMIHTGVRHYKCIKCNMTFYIPLKS